MRRGLTLIELIFSMVIVAIVFTVIPKLMQSMTAGMSATVKEDAIYNTMAFMGIINNVAWDESNTQSNAILHVKSADRNMNLDCNSTGGVNRGYRVGGFVGGRNCIENKNATLTADFNDSDGVYNDIDDYNGYDLNTNLKCGKKLYKLGVIVEYVKDNNIEDNTTTSTTNVKHVKITTEFDSSYNRKIAEPCIVFDYYSYNIGQVAIKKRRWQ